MPGNNRKRKDRRVLESTEQRLPDDVRWILEQLPVPVVVVREEAAVYANECARTFLGEASTEEGPRGQPGGRKPFLPDLAVSSCAFPEPSRLGDATGPDQDEWVFENTWLDGNGEEVRIRWRAKPLYYDGRRWGTVYVGDSAEVFRLKKEIEALEKLSTAGELATSVAHEFRNGMSAVKGIAQLIAECGVPRRRERLFRLLFAEIDRLDSLIQDYLALCTPSRGEAEIVDLAALLEETIMLVEGTASKNGIVIEKDIGKALPRIKVNPSQMKRVFLNLIKNAVEAMPSGGTLKISTGLDNLHLTVSFKDSGTGIPATVLRNIFTPFYSTKENGTGLGLALSLSIVQSYGGQILVETGESRGSCFTVVLPVQPPEN